MLFVPEGAGSIICTVFGIMLGMSISNTNTIKYD
jgi:hypothetical protein